MIGKSLAHYEITDMLGKGGMGEVYRARDTKLGREVALKILPQEMSGDPERAARFDREARTLASLQHPNVASIYGFEDAEGLRFLVMELVEGQDLSQRIEQGALSIDETLRIARQLAAGLEAAHEKGIVHRDLKPANVMLTGDGDVKVLDFGLARAWFGDAGDEADITTSPTITAAMTQAGTILGTAAYMSPEQARGRNVDRRADIWAFGVILWEMVTGQKLFDGETISDTLAAVLRAEPEWSELPAEQAPALCRLIERCLVRDPQQRLRDIGEARILLQDGGEQLSHLSTIGTAAAVEPAVSAPSKNRWPLITVVSLLMLALGLVVGWKLLASAPPERLLHAMLPPPENVDFNLSSTAPGPAVLSPDERMATFAGRDEEGTNRLYLRHLDREGSVLLSGTEGAAYPFWSPDSRYVGFFTPNLGQKLKKIAVGGGPPVTLCPASNGKGGTWNEEGTIIFAPSHDSGLFRVPATGGEPVAITELTEGVNSHRHPRFLPGGDTFLFLARQGDSSVEYPIMLGSLDGAEPRELTLSQSQAEYSNGHLLTTREGVLMAAPFDPATGELSAARTPLVENVLVLSSGSAVGSYSASTSGVLIYQTGVSETDRLLQWVRLESEETGTIGARGQLFHPRISPDGTQCMVEVLGEAGAGFDLWLVDLETGLRTRFTFGDGNERHACWTPDGAAVIYTEELEGIYRLVRQPIEGSGGSTVLFEREKQFLGTSIAPDGSRILLNLEREDNNLDIVSLPLSGEGEPRDVVASEILEAAAEFSPDGRWIAYFAASSQQWDVFVIPAEGGPRKWQVSTVGTVYPQWSADGNRLFVSGFNGNVIAYDVDAGGDTFRVGNSKVVALTESPTPNGVAYSIHPDGQRILRAGADAGSKSDVSLIHVVTDWTRALAQ